MTATAPVATLRVHPPTLTGTAIDRATGTRVAVTARRTGTTIRGIDSRRYEVYDAVVPFPADWCTRGRVFIVWTDRVPARSAVSFHFTGGIT